MREQDGQCAGSPRKAGCIAVKSEPHKREKQERGGDPQLSLL